MIYSLKYYFVYILKCSDNSYYTGFTNNIERRLAEHQSGKKPDCYTFYRRPVELVFGEYFLNPNDAIAFEKQVKGWSRAKKEALIIRDWDRIKFLARNKSSSRDSENSE
jgi:putative endonuclease